MLLLQNLLSQCLNEMTIYAHHKDIKCIGSLKLCAVKKAIDVLHFTNKQLYFCIHTLRCLQQKFQTQEA